MLLYSLSKVEELIEKAVAEDQRDIADPWIYMTKLENSSAKATAEQALSIARRIIEEYPQSSIALRMAGRAALISGNVDESISLLSSAAQIDPNSATTWFELGLAYFSMMPDLLQLRHSFNKVLVPFQIISNNDEIYQNEQYWYLNNILNKDDWWLDHKPVKRHTIFGSNVILKVSLPNKDMALVFWTAVPSNSKPLSFYVTITANANNVVTTYSYTSEHFLAWQPTFIDLSEWRGSEIEVTLSADQLIGWGDISFVGIEEVSCRITNCDERAILAWQRGGFLPKDFISAATVAFGLGKYELSLTWYQRFLIFDSQSSDIWYSIGRSFMAQGNVDDALQSYQLSLKLNNFSSVGKSSVYCYMADMYRYVTQPPQHETAWELYQHAIRISDFRDNREASHCYHQVGEIYWWSGNIDQAIYYFEQSITFDDQYVWPYLFLAKAYYKRDNNADIAKQYILKSIELYRDNPWAYYELGNLYHKLERCVEAKEMYEKVLQLDDQFMPALEMLRKSKCRFSVTDTANEDHDD